MRQFRLLVLVLWALPMFTQAQTGPGGVENITSTSNIRIWVAAEDITGLNNNDLVSNWIDRTSESNTGTSFGGPLYTTTAVNGLPAITFDGGDYFDFLAPGITGSFEFFFVLRANSVNATGGTGDGAGDYILDRTIGTTPLASLKAAAGPVYMFQKRNDIGSIGSTSSTTNISTAGFQVVSMSRDANTQYAISVNGVQESTLAETDGTLTMPALRLGRHATNATGGIDGQIAEFIVFGKYLNTVERNVVNNYLSSKYALSTITDLYVYDQLGTDQMGANADIYDNDVAGIGEETGPITQLVANSSLEMQIQGTEANLSTGDYVLLGHDGGNNTAWVTSESPTGASNFERIAREWRVDRTSYTGDITLRVDETALPGATYGEYVLLVDTDDGDFANSAIYLLTDEGTTHAATFSNALIPDGAYVSIGNITKSISLTSSTASGFESLDPTITVSLNYTPITAITFNYQTADNTAVSPGDFTALNTTGTISACTTSTAIVIDVNNADITPEQTEDFNFTISSPSDGGSVGIGTVAYSILDDDNTIKASFVSTSSSGGEASSSTVFVSIQISGTDTSPITVSYQADGGTATNGVDYSLVPGFVTIPVGATQSFFSFTVNDDAFEETNETVEITLTSTTGNASMSETPGDLTFTYTITDDDNVPLVQFPSTSSTIAESVTPGSIQIDLSAAAQGDVTVDYTVTGLALGSNVDHGLADGSLTINAGSVSGNISFAVIDDNVPELTEDIIVTLTGATGASLGTNTVFTYNIADNDEFGQTGPGGVGGTMVNRLWLRVEDNASNLIDNIDANAPLDGEEIIQWDDISGNNLNGTSGGDIPQYESGELNGKGVVRFGGNDYVDPPNLSISNSTSGYSYWMVARVDASPAKGSNVSSGGDYLLDRTTGTANLVSLKVTGDGGGTGGTDRYGFQKRTDAGTALGGPVSSAGINTGTFEIINLSRLRVDANNADYFMHINGTQQGTETGNPNEGETTPPTPRIGRHATIANDGIIGDIAEFFIYGSYLNDTRRIIVQNYLSSRYSLVIADDRYAYDANYGEDVSGIGKESADNDDFHDSARSSGLLNINNPSSLEAGDYLMFGHNGGSINDWDDTNNLPGAAFRILDRVWQFDETGDIGTVDLTFNADSLPTLPAGFTNYYLFIDNDNDLTNGFVSQTLLSVSGSDRIASGLDIADGNYIAVGVQNDILINFVTTAVSVSEATTSINVTVNLSQAAGTQVDVDYAVTGGTATGGGTDYTLASGTLNFIASDTQETFNIDINEIDTEVEVDETIIIQLSNGVVGAVGDNATITVTINDDDNNGFIGPGGVGDNTINQVWLSADVNAYNDGGTILASDGDGVQTWGDQSANAFNAVQTTSLSRPALRTNQINGKPVVSFDGTDDFFNTGYAGLGGSGLTFFLVVRGSNPQSSIRLQDSGGSYVVYPWQATTNTNNFIISADGATGNGLEHGFTLGTAWNIGTAYYDNGNLVDGFRTYNNGALVGSRGSNGATLPTDPLFIGRYDPGASEYTNADIAEIIVYDVALNSAQRKIIQNYLAAKYELPLSSDDIYAYEGAHGEEVAGIGRDNATNFHTTAQSGGFLRVSNASSLEDGDFLLFGHDNGDINTFVSSEIPGTNIQRLTREWRFDKTNDVGTVRISIPQSQLPTLPTGYERYTLLVDADGDFSSGSQTQYVLALDGTDYVASGISLTDGDFVAVAAINAVISFATISADFNEAIGNATITANLNWALDQDVTFDYTVLGSSTATGAGIDYTLANGMLTVLASQTSADLSVPIEDDMIEETVETIVLQLSNASIGEIDTGNDTFTATIVDNDSNTEVDFTVAASSGSESNIAPNITVRLNQVNPSNTVSVDYTVTGGTATGGGTDYTLANGTLNIPANNLTGLISPVLNSDVVSEVNETIEITLSNPINANLGTNTVHTFSIIDDDNNITVNFSQSHYSVNENAGNASWIVELSEVSGSDVVIDYVISGGTATGSGTDYTLSGNQVTILAGTFTASISATINDDGSVEGAETAQLTISTTDPDVMVGATNVATLTIVDNDLEGSTGPGGVGNNSTNQVWFSADVNAYSDAGTTLASNGEGVQTWGDQSSNSFNATQATGGSRPTFVDNVINGKPVLSFDGTDDFIQSNYVGPGSSGLTFFLVVRGSNPRSAIRLQSSGYVVYPWQAAATTENFILSTDGGTGGGLDDGFNLDGNIWNIGTAYYDGTNATDGFRTYNNSSLVESQAANGTTLPSNSLTIGRYDPGASEYTNGQIAEIIVYDVALNTAQRKIIENYLAAKYELPLTANDIFAYEISHGEEVAGIGQDDANNRHLGAQSAGILAFSNPNGLNNGDFLLFGHDNGDITAWTSTDVPTSGAYQRVSREWRLDLTGDGNIGQTNVTIDASQLPAVPDASYESYFLLTDPNGLFNDATATPLVSNGDGTYSASINPVDADYVTVAIGAQLVQFSLTASTIGEQNGPALLEITSSFETSQNITLDYTISNATATNGSDFTLSNGQVTLNQNTNSTFLVIPIINDSNTGESGEFIEITLSNPSSGSLGLQTVHTLTINDDDELRDISFNTTSASANEADGNYNITFQLSFVDNVNPTTVDFAVIGGTAIGGGVDYLLASGTATIAATFSTTTVPVVINEDALFESSETLIVQLSSPTNASVGTNNQFTLTINDNDTQPNVTFKSGTVAGSEAVSPGAIEVVLSSFSGQDVTVDYVATDGTATSADYSLPSGTLTISAGSESGFINPIINEDNDIEGGETFTVSLSNAQGATLVSPTALTFTIADNDSDGFTGPGGVGNHDSNVGWFAADQQTFSDGGITAASNGNSVELWNDISGNSVAAVSAGSSRPTYRTNQVNGKPVLRFDGTDDFLTTTLNGPGGVEMTYFIVANGSNYQSILRQQSSGYMVYPWGGGDGTNNFIINNDGGTGNGLEDGFVTSQWNIGVASYIANTTNGMQTFRNGALIEQRTSANITLPSNNLVIGRYDPGASEYTNADIAELIMYEAKLNNAQRIIVENYLAAKYEITIANDYYSLSSTYGDDVAGIGREDSNNEHLKSQSAGMLYLASPSALGDGEYMLFGHDGADASAWTSLEVPTEVDGGTNIQRIRREWAVDETGDVGNLTVGIDLSSLPALPTGFNSYYILVDTDNDFSAGATLYPASFTEGSYYEASGVELASGNYISIGVTRNIVGFELTSSNEFEGNSPASVGVALNYATNSDVTLNYTLTNGSAINGSDFSVVDGQVTITAGNILANIEITIINDTEVESAEDFTITLSGLLSGLTLGDDTHTFTIDDDDNNRKLFFTNNDGTGTGTETASGLESVTPVTVDVSLVNPDLTNTTTVEYRVKSGGTAAEGGVDFTLAAGTASILPTQTTTSFTFTVEDDAIAEEVESFTIELFNPVNGNLGDPSIAQATEYTYSITDNDVDPSIQFSATASSASEGAGTVDVTLELSAISGRDVSVAYALSGTATQNNDYLLNAGTVTLTAGNSIGDISITIADDSEVELSETLILTISSPTNATIGGNTVHTLTINDNDSEGFTGPGGVGDMNTNKLWLAASSLTQADGSGISAWTDLSGNNHDAIQSTAANQPTFENAAGDLLNGNPVVRLDQTNNQYFSTGYSGPGGTEFTFFTVVNGSDYESLVRMQSSGYVVYPWGNNDLILSTDGGTGGGLESGLVQSAWNIGAAAYISNTATNGAQTFLNGNVVTERTSLDVTVPSNSLVIGRYDPGASEYTNADVAEIIIYSSKLFTAKRRIVENYLSAKYNLSIGANDRFASTTYIHDVAGIGSESDGSHSKAQSGIFLSVGSPSSLDVGDYLMFGHDNAGVGTWNTTEIPSVSYETLDQEWVLEKTNDVGTVTVSVEDVGSLPALNANFNGYGILIDDDSDFSDGDETLYILSSVGGNVFEAPNVVLSNTAYLKLAALQNVAVVNNSDFSNPATWSLGIVPGAGQQAVIDNNNTIYLSQDVTVGFLKLNMGSTLEFRGFNLTIDSDSIQLETGTTLDYVSNGGGGTVTYSSTGNQNVSGRNYNNLVIDGSGIKTLLGPIDVDGSLTINSELNVSSGNNFQINLAGDYTNNAIFTAQNGLVVFDGTGNQSIGGTNSTFYQVQVNKASGVVNVTSFPVVSNFLTMTAGNIVLSANDLTIGQSGDISASSASYIVADGTGRVVKLIGGVMGSYFGFPVGDGINYTPFDFQLNAATIGTNAAVSVNLDNAVNINLRTNAPHISRYWTLQATDLSGTINYNMAFVYNDLDDVVGNETELVPIKFFTDVDTSGYVATTDYNIDIALNRIFWNGLSSFGELTAGLDEDNGTALPVDLLYVRGEALVEAIQIEWATASETNNNYFSLEKTQDFKHFKEVGRLNGAGNSSERLTYKIVDYEPYSGISYYRVRQTDFDGTTTVSEPVRMLFNHDETDAVISSVYPVPFKLGEGINIRVKNLLAGSMLSVDLYTLDGIEVVNERYFAGPEGHIETKLLLPETTAVGEYVLKIGYENDHSIFKVIAH